MIAFIPNYYKNQKICDKAIDYYSRALELMLDYYKTQITS